MASTRFLRRQVQKNSLTAKDLQQDLVETGTKVSAYTERHILKVDDFHARSPRHTPLLTQQHKKRRFQFA